ncbi:MAG TPA: dual specificity protein phosphatase family protein [Gemmataceae bacterium]|nr:dual specificity protein phosphatase family protein [Gemmataceae bacterium]
MKRREVLSIGQAATAGRPWLAAALWTLFLGLLFFLVYGTCNYLTSLRVDVGTCYLAWERAIPFVPIFIIPYMSLDLFFAAAPFLCRDRSEIHLLAKRIALAIGISACCFLLFPLRYGWARPPVDGLLGPVFGFLTELDQPYNLAPSLHISLRSIVWAVYGLHLRGAVRRVTGCWFVLIGVSTLLVYQHHVIDVLGGYVVAVLCFYVVPARAAAASSVGSYRRGLRQAGIYGSLALVCGVLAWVAWPWGAILLWPAAALTVVALGYGYLGPAIFRKSGGRLPWSARLLLGPYLLGAYLSSLGYRGRLRLYDEIVPGLLLGCRLNETEARTAVARGVCAVLDLTAEYSEPAAFLALPYRNVQILDLTAPTVEQLHEAVSFVRERAWAGKVYVHCALGRSRSAVVVAAYCLALGVAPTVAAAVALVRRARPQVVFRDDMLAVLEAYRESLAAHRIPLAG